MDEHEYRVMAKLVTGDRMTVLPGDEITPGTQWQVCVLHPTPGSGNHQAPCFVCGAMTYRHQDMPGLKIICVSCFVKKAEAEEVECVSNTNTLAFVVNHAKRN